MSYKNLIIETNSFFKKFWNNDNGLVPVWSDTWEFEGEIPNNNKGGCYALFNDKDEVVYIGVGIAKGEGLYKNCGIGHRVSKYWKVNKSMEENKKYSPVDLWSKIKSVRTIGFEKECVFLALALEAYLISNMNPERNSNYTIPNQ